MSFAAVMITGKHVFIFHRICIGSTRNEVFTGLQAHVRNTVPLCIFHCAVHLLMHHVAIRCSYWKFHKLYQLLSLSPSSFDEHVQVCSQMPQRTATAVTFRRLLRAA